MKKFYFFRFKIVFFSLVFAFVLIFCRLIYLQAFAYKNFQSHFLKQSLSHEKLDPLRGSVFDRNGQIFSVSHYQYTVKILPQLLVNKKETVEKLHRILHIDRSVIKKKMESSQKAVYLKRRIDNQTYKTLRQARIKGISFDREEKREYPQKKMACHVLGFVGDDGTGLEGIEARYDPYLRGKEGRKSYLKDGRSKQLLAFQTDLKAPKHGCDVILTLDQRIQHIVEREMHLYYQKEKAKSVSVVVLNPNNGNILALATEPSFDLNDRSQFSTKQKRNPVITDPFEPGSTFKIVTFAAALEKGVVRLDDKIFCENGSYKTPYRKKPLHDHAPHGWLTVHQVLQKSSNIGSVKIAEKIGKRKLFAFIKRFGFGQKTQLNLLGESAGVVRKLKDWGKTSILSVPIGHEIEATCLQMVLAMSVIANKGSLFSPKIVHEIRQRDGRLVLKNETHLVRRVISQKIAEQLTNILESVVSLRGTAFRAKIPHLRVAGKTGTAQKYDRLKKQYSHRKFFSSFIGFFPVENPQYCMGVFVDEPRYGRHYGGHSAGSLFRKIGEKINNLSL